METRDRRRYKVHERIRNERIEGEKGRDGLFTEEEGKGEETEVSGREGKKQEVRERR